MPAALPNRKNNVKLSAKKAAQAQAAIRNFAPAMPWPPVTAAAQAQLKAAVAPFLAEINKTQQTSAKKASPTGVGAPPAAQLVAQQGAIGASIPGIAKFLPTGTDLGSTSYADAITQMQSTVAQIENLTINPAAGGLSIGLEMTTNYLKNI